MPRKTLKPVAEQTGFVNVLVDTRDARLDRVVPTDVAKALYKTGKLSWCITNGCFCVPENGVCIPELVSYKMRG
jgi:hypothetical protein